jgi:predicted small secreted protein
MSRKVRALVAIVVLSFAFSAAACANAVGPHGMQCADTSGSGTCY